MRKATGLVWCTAAVLGSLACGSGPAGVDAAADPTPTVTERVVAVGDTVTLAVGESRGFEGGATVTFLALVADSRCPTGVTCVWQGDAEVLLRIERNGTASEASLHTTLEPRSEPVGPHRLELLDVLPYPAEPPPNDPPEPRVLLRLVPPA